MEVYVGYQCYYNYCDVFSAVEKVFDNEVKALIWVDEFKNTETEWREYNAFTVE